MERDDMAASPTSTPTRPRTSRASSRATRRATTRSMPGHNARRHARPPRARPGINPKAREPIDPRMPNLSPGVARSAPARAAPELAFAVDGRRARSSTPRSPTLRFALRVERSAARAVRSVAARRADPDRRAPARLRRRARTTGCSSCSGRRSDWGTTLRTLLWTRTTLVVPAVRRARRVVELDVPCTYDLEVAASRYLDALRDGEVPLEFLFSGSVFYAGADGRLQTARHRLGAARRSTALPGARVAGDDGAPLPRHGVAAAAQGQLRPPRRRTSRATRWRRWDDALDALLAERVTRPGPRASPTPCSTRATCCGRTGARR